MKRRLLLVLVTSFFVFIGTALPVLAYDYPIKPATKKWVEAGDTYDRVQSCQIPEEELKKMSTEELIESVLEYPFLMDIYAYDSLQVGFESVVEKFNGLSELLQRDDAAVKLLSRYKGIVVVDTLEKESCDLIFDLANLEVILSQVNIIEQLDDNGKIELEKVIEDKYLLKREQSDIYGFTSAIAYRMKLENESKFVDAQTAATYYVYTPRGTAVPVLRYGELLSPTEKVFWDNYVRDTFPGATVVRTATTNYNCHSYAWYSTSSGNLNWMSNPGAYMSDGSYIRRSGGVTGNRINDKIYYGTPNYLHSGIVYARSMGGNAYVQSKWGSMGLVKHYYSNCPYYFGTSTPISFWYR